MPKTKDYTAIPLRNDPARQRMIGNAYWGDTPFDVPYISHISDNLWTGGCTNSLILPNNIQHVISLYPWEKYKIKHDVKSISYNYLYDDDVPDLQTLRRIVSWGSYCVADAPTLIHCQAGLNRSGLIAACVLMSINAVTAKRPLTMESIIGILRDRRSPAVLCNPKFEAWLLNEAEDKLLWE